MPKNLPFVSETVDTVLGYEPFVYEIAYGAFKFTCTTLD